MHVRTASVAGGFTSDDETCVIHKINRPLPQAALTLQFRRGDLLDDVRFDLIRDLHVIKVLETDTAFESFAYFRHVVFKTSQGSDVSFPRHDAIANQPRASITANDSINNHATGDCTNSRHAEDFT